MINPQYVIDSSIIIRRSKHQVYELDSFPYHWKNFDDKIQEGKFISIPTVQKEIFEKDKSAVPWTKKNDILFNGNMNDSSVVKELNDLSANFPVWYKEGNKKKRWADPELIAFAKANGLVLVTCESWNYTSTKEKKFKIPTICSKIGAYCKIRNECSQDVENSFPFQCIDFIELIKREELFKI